MSPSSALLDVVSRTRNLLLDFDGPVCSIFADYTAPTIAAELRELLRRRSAELTPEIEASDDPIHVLRLTSAYHDADLAAQVADALREAEVTAAATAEPTPSVGGVIHTALRTGRRLAIVSNNSMEAVTAYLHRQGLYTSFSTVVARYQGMSVDLLKPSGHLVGQALTALDAQPSSCTLVGDATSDIAAARSVPVASIGYTNKPEKATLLEDAGADAIVFSMADLAEALSATPAAN